MTMTIPAWRMHHRLSLALEAAGYSVQGMADSLGMSRDTVSSWINGRRQPTKAQTIAWATLTGVPVWWLESGAEEPPADGEGALAGSARPKGLEPLTFWFGADVDRAADDFLRCLGLERELALVLESPNSESER